MAPRLLYHPLSDSGPFHQFPMSALTPEEMRSHSNIQRLHAHGDDRMDVDEGMNIAMARSMEDQDSALEANSIQDSGPSRPRALPSTPLTGPSSTSEFPPATTLNSGYTLSSPETPIAMPGGHPLDDSPLFSMELPPPNYASAVKQGQAKPLCIVCGQRNAYNDGMKAFPTCGNNCARKLKSIQGLDTRSYGHPYSSTYERSSGSSSYSNRYDFRSQSPPIKMCIVCKTRPRYEKGGKSYDTCGLTCAAKLGPKSADKCEFCQIKPKAYVNNKQVPYCSTICRDKAQALATAVANSSTCTTCLVCWRATKVGDKDDLCSPNCHDVLQANSPCLLEIPRGHVSFKKVSDVYLSAWKDTKYPCPQIKRIYMVNLAAATKASYLAYENRILEQSRTFIRSRKANTKTRWLGVSRQCVFGDTGSTVPCAIPSCFLCSLVRTEIHPQVFAKGIISTGILERAISMSSKKREKARSKLVVLANVIHGQEAELAIDEDMILPQGADSIRLLQRRPTLMSGKLSHYDESIVFAVEAVRPLYIISYESP